MIESPPSVGELAARLPLIHEWQRQVRSFTSALGMVGADEVGRLIALTGAKGGVGTSTLALHLALLAAASNPERRVCLIDLDLQQRGIRQLVDLTAKRTISDLVPVAESLTGRNLDEATIVHRTGLRFLLAPPQGEHSEDIDGTVARQILAAAKGHYDLVIVDAGSVVTEASAVGMEFADELLLVTTPDIASLRAAQDKYELLNRLHVLRDEGVQLVFNKVSSRNEVQPDFGSRMSVARVCRVSVPEDWRKIEPAANSLNPTEVDDGPFRRAMIALGRELRLAAVKAPEPVVEAPARRRGRRRLERNAAGQVTIEALVGLIVSVVILLVLLQTALMALGTVVARRAADEAARVGSRGGDASAAQAAHDQAPGFYRVVVSRDDENTYTATVKAPTLVPWLNQSVSATGSAAEED